MKCLRVLLLVLLAASLPIRSVMAAAMLCPVPPGMGATAHAANAGVAAAHPAPADRAHLHAHAHTDHHHATHAIDAQGLPFDHGTGHEGCSHCVASCSSPPLAGAVPGIPPPDLAHTGFPTLAVPEPSFLSDGPERPPRSI